MGGPKNEESCKKVYGRQLFFVFLLLGFVFFTWPAMQARYELACSTVWAVVITELDGQVVSTTSTPYQQCEWITTYSGGSTPPRDQDRQPEPGGGGTPPVINYDTNNSGFVDCYQTAIFHTTSLTITSTCEEVRGSVPHNALDLWIPNIDGKAAYSVCNGTVEKVDAQRDGNGALTGWGYYVEIKDPAGNIWRYAHLKGTNVDPSGVGLTKGSQIAAGTSQVGLCDSSGAQTAHLHLEYWKDGVKTCPVSKLGNCSTKA
jgi:hypothetical protein